MNYGLATAAWVSNWAVLLLADPWEHKWVASADQSQAILPWASQAGRIVVQAARIAVQAACTIVTDLAARSKLESRRDDHEDCDDRDDDRNDVAWHGGVHDVTAF